MVRTYAVIDDGGHEYRGTALAVISQMHNLSFAPATSDEAWMMQVAERAFTQTGREIDCEDPDKFVEGMIDSGLLKPVKE